MVVLLVVLVAVVVLAAATVAVLVSIGPGPGLAPKPTRDIDLAGLPPLERVVARDGTPLAHRAYPAATPDRVVVLVHGTAVDSRAMHPLASRLREEGATVYALDLRGHGASGRRGDIDHRGQLDEDLADLLAVLGPRHAGTPMVLTGFSGGAAFCLRVAGGPLGPQFERVVLLAPAFVGPSGVARRGTGGWAKASIPRIVGLLALGRLHIHRFDGLDAITFAVPPDDDRWTPRSSFRLALDLGDRRPRSSIARVRIPVTLVAGRDDDQFHAERYEGLLRPAYPDLVVDLVPGLDHVDLITEPRGTDAIARAIHPAPVTRAST